VPLDAILFDESNITSEHRSVGETLSVAVSIAVASSEEIDEVAVMVSRVAKEVTYKGV
jgi:hypothetical protein